MKALPATNFNSKGVPIAGLTIVGILMTLFALTSISPDAASEFGKISSVTVLLTIVPYLYTCAALLLIGHGHLGTAKARYVAIMTVVVIATASPSLTKQFNEIINMAVILVVLPYLYSAVTFLQYEASKPPAIWRHVRAVVIVAVASAYCLWVIAGSDDGLVRDAMILLFLSIPIYPFFERRMRGVEGWDSKAGS